MRPFRIWMLLSAVALVAIALGVGKWSIEMNRRSVRYQQAARHWHQLGAQWIKHRDRMAARANLLEPISAQLKYHAMFTKAAEQCEEFAKSLDRAATFPWIEIPFPPAGQTIPDPARRTIRVDSSDY